MTRVSGHSQTRYQAPNYPTTSQSNDPGDRNGSFYTEPIENRVVDYMYPQEDENRFEDYHQKISERMLDVNHPRDYHNNTYSNNHNDTYNSINSNAYIHSNNHNNNTYNHNTNINNNINSNNTITTTVTKQHRHSKSLASIRGRLLFKTLKTTTDILSSYDKDKKVRWASQLVDVHTYNVPKTSGWSVLRQKLRKAVTAIKDDIDL